jgi:hypothetical protein
VQKAATYRRGHRDSSGTPRVKLARLPDNGGIIRLSPVSSEKAVIELREFFVREIQQTRASRR